MINFEMMNKDEKIIENLLAGGLIGAALGAILSKNNKGDGVTLGALLGAAILATLKANEDAKKTSVSVLEEENGRIYELHPDGTKHLVKTINKPKKNSLSEKFKLK